MKVIFLDIDGVLNSSNYFDETSDVFYNYIDYLDEKYELEKWLIQIDMNKLYLLKEIIDRTNSKVVVSSSWRNLKYYTFIEEYLINKGIPIIDTTKSLNNKRGLEIKTYLMEHPEITNYIIIDDDIFPDYDEELLFNLIHTNFYNDGLNDDNYEDAIYKLKK